MKNLRLGTRKSKLATVQAALVKTALQEKYPLLNIEIVQIDTPADQTNMPLVDLPENAFCLALDQALLADEIDVAVHSRKDRVSVPSDGIVTAALTSRGNPRDVAIFRNDITDVLRSGKKIVLGVCAEHRKTNIPAFLKKSLPQIGPDIQIEIKDIRGAIDKRLEKIGTDYDGIVLAVAGLNRLLTDVPQEIFKNKLYMVLPLSECPTAPGQGVLAVDCRAKDMEVRKILSVLHDTVTAGHVAREFDALLQYGTDIGATSITGKHFADHLLFAKGSGVSFINWPQTEIPAMEGPYWDGATTRAHNDNAYLSVSVDDITADAVFIAHSRAAAPSLTDTLKSKTLWTSGIHSWFRLAQQGLWVQGCTEELGHDVLKDAIDSAAFLNLPIFDEWQVLTHDRSMNDWKHDQIIATYKADATFDPQAAEEIRAAKHVFWSSATQYKIYKDYISNECNHYCRAGKTATALKSFNVSPLIIFPNHEMWCKCLKAA